MNAPPIARLMIVDDESAHMNALCDTLRDQGYETEGFESPDAALQALRERQFDLLLTDLMMPGIDGVELLARALKIDPHLVGILMTGQGTIATAVQAMKAGALDFILKPFKVSTLLPVVSRAVNVRRLRLENLELRNTVAMHELNQAIAYTLDPGVLLNKIADAALAQFEADEASVMLVAEDGESLQVAAVRGEGRELLLGKRVPIGKGIAGEVALHREPQVLQGLVGPRAPEGEPSRAPIQSSLSMPMITRNKLIGVLNINYTRQPRIFPFGQTKALSIFVNAAAAGIEAARIHEEQRKADARYREVLQMAADAIVSLDAERRIIMFNAAAERVFGWAMDEIVGQPIERLIPERLAGAHRRHLEAFDAGPETAIPMQRRGPFHARRKDGREFPAEISISKLAEGDRHVYTAVVRDITERVQHEERIARLTRLYAVLSGVNSAIVRIGDETELYAEICRIATEEGGFQLAYVGTLGGNGDTVTIVASAGLPLDGRQVTADPTQASGKGLLGRALQTRVITWDHDLAAQSDIGYLRREAMALGARAGACLPFLLGGAVHSVMLLYADAAAAFGDDELRLLRELAGDVSFALDHIAKTRKVDYLATHDQVTGLPNRALFLDRLAQAVAAARDAKAMLAVVVTDIERFRHINNSLGRQAGDSLLRAFAERIQSRVEDRSSLARVGSDVFAMIASGFSQPAKLASVIRARMERDTAAPLDIGGQPLHVATRTGIAFHPADGGDAETLFKNAEAALKRAKAQREPLVFYTPDLNARVAEHLTLESKLRRALERNEFVLHYQPKVELDGGRIAGLEALVRWHDPGVGLVPPAKFISILEDTGMILDVGRWAMQEAVRTAAALRAKGLPPVRIAVNVSPIQLRQKDFVRAVEVAIASGGGTPHGLDLEITESVIMDDIEANVRKLNELWGMDVEAAIDDFGTGYSSLAYIARLPVGVIKIDRAFIHNLEDDANNLSIVQTIISLTHALKRKVVAEGVETEPQARLLRLLRCDHYQGYLFSRPLPLEQIEALLGGAHAASAGRAAPTSSRCPGSASARTAGSPHPRAR